MGFLGQEYWLESVAICFSRGYSQPRDQTHISCVSCIGRRVLNHEPLESLGSLSTEGLITVYGRGGGWAGSKGWSSVEAGDFFSRLSENPWKEWKIFGLADVSQNPYNYKPKIDWFLEHSLFKIQSFPILVVIFSFLFSCGTFLPSLMARCTRVTGSSLLRKSTDLGL